MKVAARDVSLGGAAGTTGPGAGSSWRSRADGAVAVFLGILAWLAFTSWIRPLSLPDEGRYVGVAWEMLRAGDWLVPTLDGLPFFHKPPLFYWITAGSLSVFGVNEWAGRVAPWLGASTLAFGLHLFVRRWVGQRMARACLLVLVTQPLFFMGAQYANLDMLIAGCIGLAILAAVHAVQCMQAGLPHRNWVLATWGLAALGVLAKGLIGIVIPSAVILLWLAWSQPPRRALGMATRLVSASGLAIFVAVAGPWFVAMQGRFPDFFHYFFVVQHFQRFAGGGFNNVQPFWFFVPVLLVLTLPWSAWLWTWGRDAVRGRGSRAPAGRAMPPATPNDGDQAAETHQRASPTLRRLMWTWLVVVVVFFSVPGSKLVGYVLPACAPLAFLVADAARGAWNRPAASVWWVRSAVLAAVVCLCVVGIVVATDRSSTEVLARAYASKAGRGEPLVMLDDYFYDVPLHAKSRVPVGVVADWKNPAIGSRDNWQKELADAARFAPDKGAGVLIDATSLPALLCEAPVHWLIAPPDRAARIPWLAPLAAVASSKRASLWRIDRADPAIAAALACRSAAGSAKR